MVLDAPQELPEPAESDLDAVLSNREEEITRGHPARGGDRAHSAWIQGLELSAYVAGAKAGLLISYGDLGLSREEKQRLADILSASVDRKRLPGGIAMRDSLLQRELIQSVLTDHSELLQRASQRLVRLPPIVRRPAPPIIKIPLPPLLKISPVGDSTGSGSNVNAIFCNAYFTMRPDRGTPFEDHTW